MKRTLVIAVLVLLVVIGLPVLMPGVSGVHCSECGPATLVGAMCLAVLAAAAVVASSGSRRAWHPRCGCPALLRSAVFERPPQSALAT